MPGCTQSSSKDFGAGQSVQNVLDEPTPIALADFG